MPIKVKKREYFYNGNIMCFPLLEIRHAGILWRFSQLFMFSKSENLFTFFIIDNEKFPVAKRIFFKDLIRWKDLFLCQVENNRFVFFTIYSFMSVHCFMESRLRCGLPIAILSLKTIFPVSGIRLISFIVFRSALYQFLSTGNWKMRINNSFDRFISDFFKAVQVGFFYVLFED